MTVEIGGRNPWEPVSDYWSVGKFDRASLTTATGEEAERMEAIAVLCCGLCDENGKAMVFRIPNVLALAIVRTLAAPDPPVYASDTVKSVLDRLSAYIR